MKFIRPRTRLKRKRKCITCDTMDCTFYYKSQGDERKFVQKFQCKTCMKKRLSTAQLKRDLFCDACDYQTQNRAKLISHVYTHLNLKCNACNNTLISKVSFKFHLQKHFELYICDRCGMSFHLQYRFEQHMSIHDPNYEVTCPPIKTPRPKIGEFKCKYCSLIFNKQQSAIAHMSHVHKNGAILVPYKCKVCEKEFCYKEEFRCHGFEHYKGKVRKCDFPGCGKLFKRIYDLNTHMRSHAEASIECSGCDKVSFNLNLLEMKNKVISYLGICSKLWTI